MRVANVVRALVLVLVAAVPAAHAIVPDDGFVDVDRNGVFSAGDVPLSNFVTPDGLAFNELQKGPNWTPPNHPVDVVLARPVTFPSKGAEPGPVDVTILVRGRVTIGANLTIKRPESSVYIVSLEDGIYVKPGVHVDGNGDVDLRAYGANGWVVVGSTARLSTKGDTSTFTVFGHAVMVETGVQFVLSGAGYSNMIVNGDVVGVAPNITATTSGRGSFTLISGADLTLQHWNVKAGYLHIESYSDNTSPSAKHVRIEDSTLNQTYVHGDYRVLAGPSLATNSYAPHAIVLVRTHVTTKAPALYVPDPEIQ